jgi:hypothetical protein
MSDPKDSSNRRFLQKTSIKLLMKMHSSEKCVHTEKCVPASALCSYQVYVSRLYSVCEHKIDI